MEIFGNMTRIAIDYDTFNMMSDDSVDKAIIDELKHCAMRLNALGRKIHLDEHDTEEHLDKLITKGIVIKRMYNNYYYYGLKERIVR